MIRLEKIAVGKTYHDGKGKTRQVMKLHEPERGDVVYLNDKGTLRSCWWGTFAQWAKGEVESPEGGEED